MQVRRKVLIDSLTEKPRALNGRTSCVYLVLFFVVSTAPVVATNLQFNRYFFNRGAITSDAAKAAPTNKGGLDMRKLIYEYKQSLRTLKEMKDAIEAKPELSE